VVTVPIKPCERNTLPPELARLPRNQQEGSLPRMAVAVGDFDSIECVLRHIGIDGTEFTAPNDPRPGAIQLYDNESPGGHGAPGEVPIGDLVTNLDRMLGYQLIFLNCSDVLNSYPLLTGP